MMKVKRTEAESKIRVLCGQWARECDVRADPNGDPRAFHPSFSAFTEWMREKGYGHNLDFRSVTRPLYDAESLTKSSSKRGEIERG
jgi:hypothetical protein